MEKRRNYQEDIFPFGEEDGVKERFQVSLDGLNGFYPKYGFFDMKIRNQPYSFLNPFSAIL